MGRHFSKVGGTIILGPLKQKSQGAQAPPAPPVPTPMLYGQNEINGGLDILYNT